MKTNDIETRADICVKAMAGIPDPEAFMRTVRRFVDGDAFAVEIEEHLKGGAE